MVRSALMMAMVRRLKHTLGLLDNLPDLLLILSVAALRGHNRDLRGNEAVSILRSTSIAAPRVL